MRAPEVCYLGTLEAVCRSLLDNHPSALLCDLCNEFDKLSEPEVALQWKAKVCITANSWKLKPLAVCCGDVHGALPGWVEAARAHEGCLF